jgi:hypothetical protein
VAEMSLGYCQTHVDQLDPSSADTRYLIGSGSLPSRIKLLGFSFFYGESSTVAADRFKLFDGSTSSSVIWTFSMTGAGAVPGWVNNQSSMLMTDDTFLRIDSGLHYEVTSTNYSSSSNKLNITIYYC